MQVQVCVRSQKSVGSRNGKFGGPDTYIAVIWTENDSVTLPYVLNEAVLAHRGIHYRYVGQGYSCHPGPQSYLVSAMDRAQKLSEQLFREHATDTISELNTALAADLPVERKIRVIESEVA